MGRLLLQVLVGFVFEFRLVRLLAGRFTSFALLCRKTEPLGDRDLAGLGRFSSHLRCAPAACASSVQLPAVDQLLTLPSRRLLSGNLARRLDRPLAGGALIAPGQFAAGQLCAVCRSPADRPVGLPVCTELPAGRYAGCGRRLDWQTVEFSRRPAPAAGGWLRLAWSARGVRPSRSSRVRWLFAGAGRAQRRWISAKFSLPTPSKDTFSVGRMGYFLSKVQVGSRHLSAYWAN